MKPVEIVHELAKEVFEIIVKYLPSFELLGNYDQIVKGRKPASYF